MRSEEKNTMTLLRDERWAKHRAACERWKQLHYDYYLWQKRQLATRTEYLAHRRQMYRTRRSNAEPTDLSTNKFLNDYSSQDQATDRSADPEPTATQSATEWLRPGAP